MFISKNYAGPFLSNNSGFGREKEKKEEEEILIFPFFQRGFWFF